MRYNRSICQCKKSAKASQCGMTLLELLIAVLMLVTFTGAVVMVMEFTFMFFKLDWLFKQNIFLKQSEWFSETELSRSLLKQTSPELGNPCLRTSVRNLQKYIVHYRSSPPHMIPDPLPFDRHVGRGFSMIHCGVLPISKWMWVNFLCMRICIWLGKVIENDWNSSIAKVFLKRGTVASWR